MATTMTLDTQRIVKLLAAQYDFDLQEGLRLVSASSTSRSVRTDRTSDFLTDLAVAESKDDAKVKKPPLSAEEKAARKSAREAKKAEKEAKPKRPPTGYLMFCNEMRPAAKSDLMQLLDVGEKLPATATVKQLALQWNELSDEQKSVWNAKAAANKEMLKSGTSSESSSSDEMHEDSVPTPPPATPDTQRKPRAKKPTKDKKLKVVDEVDENDVHSD